MFGVTEQANKYLNIYSVYEQTIIIQTNIYHAIFPPLGLIAVVQKLFRTFLIFLMIYSTQLKT